MTAKRSPKTDQERGLFRVTFYLSDSKEIGELQARAKRSGLTPGQEARRLTLALMALSDKPWDPQPPEDGNLGELMDGPWNKPR